MKADNQWMVKDTHRDRKYTGTMKCGTCGEESNQPEKFPFYLKDMKQHMELFIKMHNLKGCNKDQLESPEWASAEINIGISM